MVTGISVIRAHGFCRKGRLRGLIVAIITKTRSMSGLRFNQKFSLTEHLAKIGEPPDRILCPSPT